MAAADAARQMEIQRRTRQADALKGLGITLKYAKINRDHIARGKVRYSTPPGGSNTQRQTKAAATGEVARAQQAIDYIKNNPNMSNQELKQVAAEGNRSAAQLKRARNRRSSAASSTMQREGNAQIRASQQVELNRLGGGTLVSNTLGGDSRIQNKVAPGVAAIAQPWKKGFTPETKAFGFQSTGSFEDARLKEVNRKDYKVELFEGGNPIESKQNYAYSVNLSEGGANKAQNYAYSVELNEGKPQSQVVLTPFGNLGYIYQGGESIFNRTIERDFGKMDYAYLVDKGLAKRETLTEHLAYYAAIGERPITNTLTYLGVGGEKMKQYISPTTTQQVFGNFDEAYKGNTPLSEGLGETWGMIKKDPIKTLVEIPGESGMWIGAGKVLGLGTSLAVKGSKVISQSPSYLSKTLKPESLGSTVMVKKSVGELFKRRTPIEKSRQEKLVAAQKYWKKITPVQQNIKSRGLSRSKQKLRYTVLEKYLNKDYYKKFNRPVKPSFTSSSVSMVSIGAFIARAKVTDPKVPKIRKTGKIDYSDDAEKIVRSDYKPFTKPPNKPRDYSEYKEIKTSSGTLLVKTKQVQITKQVQKTMQIQKTKQMIKPKLATKSITKVRLKQKTKVKQIQRTSYGTILTQKQTAAQSTAYKLRQKQAQRYKTKLLTKQTYKQPQKQTPKLKQKTPTKPITTTKIIIKTPPRTIIPPIIIPKTPPTRPPTPPRRPPIVAWIPQTQKRREVRPKSRTRKRVDFIGNTRVAEIGGFRTKKSSIEYGKKTQRIFDEDLNKTRRKKNMKIKRNNITKSQKNMLKL